MYSKIIRFSVLSLALSSGACSEVVEPRLPPNGSLDGETIFRGLTFGEEPVAQVLPEVWDRTAAERPDWTATQHEVFEKVKSLLIARMRADDPSFFDRFRTEMTSGDPVKITHALDESAARLTSSIEKERGVFKGSPGGAGADCLALTVAIAGAAIEVVVVFQLGNVVMLINVAVNQNAVYNQDAFWGHGHDQGSSAMPRLQRDEVAGVLSRRLKGR